MKETLAAGLRSTATVEVDRDRTIGFLGEGMRLYATPSMINDVEYACLNLIQPHLDDGESSVGIHVGMDHVGATPLGQSVEIALRIAEVDGRKITVEAEIRDAIEVVGRCTHSRFVIDVARHGKRVDEKRAKLPETR